MAIEPAFLFDSVRTIFENFLRNIRIVDVLDITVIAFFLYIVLNWLRQSAPRSSLVSLLGLFLIYVLARATGMYMTERLLEFIFIVILIGVVVIFQSDMRRIIDRIGSWSFFKKPVSNSPLEEVTSTLTEACSKMAEIKRGALIAIKGSEDWSRHLHGGIELQGKVTIPLLLSIFNTKAPGHDGAVLLEEGKILKFGVHLPLSINLQKMNHGGTRHTAALGLSEQCNALILVVSEERGVISIAKDGQIFELESSGDLTRHLKKFWEKYYGESSPAFVQWWKRRSLRTALGSLALAFILWFSFAYPSGTVYRTYSVPIEFRNLQSTNITLQDSMPSSVRVTLSGTDQAFQTFDPADMIVSFDLSSEISTDGVFQITKKNINLPNDLKFYEASPRQLTLKTRKLKSMKLPVKVPTTGQLSSDLTLVSIKATPARINVLTDSAFVSGDSVSTYPVDLSKVQNSTHLQQRLQLKDDTLELPEDESRQVVINIKVQKKTNK